MRNHILIGICACLATTGASAGYVQDVVEANGGCDGPNWAGTSMLLTQKVPSTDGLLLQKKAGDWTDQDLEEYRRIYADCLRLHPGEVMTSFKIGEPIEAPPGAIEAKVDERMNEIMRKSIEPARKAKRQEETSLAARRSLADARERARINEQRAQARSAEVAADTRREQERTREQERSSALQEQAKRDREAAEQAKLLADREAPQIEATQKEASSAHRARVAAEQHLENIRQQIVIATKQRLAEDATSAEAKAKQLQIEQQIAQRANEKREYEALAKTCSVTAEKFSKLVLGMSLREVRRAFGCVGSLSASVDGEGLGALSTYLWKGARSESAAITTFNGDRLVARAQSALD